MVDRYARSSIYPLPHPFIICSCSILHLSFVLSPWYTLVNIFLVFRHVHRLLYVARRVVDGNVLAARLYAIHMVGRGRTRELSSLYGNGSLVVCTVSASSRLILRGRPHAIATS